MQWAPILPTVVALVVALVGVYGVRYSARLTESREALNWVRQERLKAYSILLGSVEKAAQAFPFYATESCSANPALRHHRIGDRAGFLIVPKVLLGWRPGSVVLACFVCQESQVRAGSGVISI